MKLTTRILSLALAAGLLLSPSLGWCTPSGLNGDQTIPNLGTAKKLFGEYYKSGRYAEEIKSITAEAKKYLLECVTHGHKEKLAMVLDIDETSLSNAPHIMEFDYGYLPDKWHEWILSGKAPAIEGTLELYKCAVENGVEVYFFTGRHEDERASTERNLAEAGYTKYSELVLKPTGSPITSKEFKTRKRKELTEKGYRIIINVGDQMSDLEGGYADSVYKLPNPMYFVP